MEIQCLKHPGYYGESNGSSASQHVNLMNSLTWIKLAFRQMKDSLVELKNGIDQDVHTWREGSRCALKSGDNREDCTPRSSQSETRATPAKLEKPGKARRAGRAESRAKATSDVGNRSLGAKSRAVRARWSRRCFWASL